MVAEEHSEVLYGTIVHFYYRLQRSPILDSFIASLDALIPGHEATSMHIR
jgi:hypothetical protein